MEVKVSSDVVWMLADELSSELLEMMKKEGVNYLTAHAKVCKKLSDTYTLSNFKVGDKEPTVNNYGSLTDGRMTQTLPKIHCEVIS